MPAGPIKYARGTALKMHLRSAAAAALLAFFAAQAAAQVPPVSAPSCAYCDRRHPNHRSDCPYPSWLDHQDWEVGYAWVSLSFLPLVPNVDLYRSAQKDLARFSDLAEGISPVGIVFTCNIGVDGQKKPRWATQFYMGDLAAGVQYIGQAGQDSSRVPFNGPELVRRRAQSPSHRPLKARVGDREAWVIADQVGFIDQAFATLEIYLQDPFSPQVLAAASIDQVVRPAAVWIVARSASPEGWRPRAADVPYVLQDRVYRLASFSREENGALSAFEARPWEIPLVEDLFDGADSEAYVAPRQGPAGPAAQQFGELRVKMEAAFNDKLIEWKSAEMPKRIAASKPEDLAKLAVRLEKALLRLDLRARQLKDAADEDARQANPQAGAAKAPPKALDRAHLLEQRKTILAVILGAVKRAGTG